MVKWYQFLQLKKSLVFIGINIGDICEKYSKDIRPKELKHNACIKFNQKSLNNFKIIYLYIYIYLLFYILLTYMHKIKHLRALQREYQNKYVILVTHEKNLKGFCINFFIKFDLKVLV